MFVGSHWITCTDLDEATDNVVESKVVSCLDFYENGVLEGFPLKEVNNRTWQSFRCSCRNLMADCRMGSESRNTDFLFQFEKDGKLYDTTIPEQPSPVRNSGHACSSNATTIHDAGEKGRKLDDFNFSHTVPNAFGLGGLIGTSHWQCPPGMVMSGAAIGHNPDRKGNDHVRSTFWPNAESCRTTRDDDCFPDHPIILRSNIICASRRLRSHIPQASHLIQPS